MTSQRPFRGMLDASLDSRGTISGSLTARQGEPVPFTGWLGLVGAIEKLAERAEGKHAEPSHREDSIGEEPGEAE